MQTEIALSLLGVPVAIILFILEKTTKTLPRYLVVIGYTVSALLIGFSILMFLNIFDLVSAILIFIIIIFLFVYLTWRGLGKKTEIIENYTFEQLTKGITVCVPPAKTTEIHYIELKKGNITQIQINSLGLQNDKENYIDRKLLNRWGVEVLKDARIKGRGYGVAIPLKKSALPKGQPNIKPGLYRLVLSNEYQKDSEKQVRIQVSYLSYSGNFVATVEVGEGITWD